MGIEKIRITNVLEMRYDYLSARNVLNNWRKANGIKDEIDNFSDADLRSLVVYLKNETKNTDRAIAALERMILSPDAGGPTPDSNVARDDHNVEDHSNDVPAESYNDNNGNGEEIHNDDNYNADNNYNDNADNYNADNGDNYNADNGDNGDANADNGDNGDANADNGDNGDNGDANADNGDAAPAEEAHQDNNSGKKKKKNKK